VHTNNKSPSNSDGLIEVFRVVRFEWQTMVYREKTRNLPCARGSGSKASKPSAARRYEDVGTRCALTTSAYLYGHRHFLAVVYGQTSLLSSATYRVPRARVGLESFTVSGMAFLARRTPNRSLRALVKGVTTLVRHTNQPC